MKKTITAAVLLLLAALLFLAGRASGIRHALEDSEIWTVEIYDPENPAEQEIYIDLDGETYVHTIIQC